MHEIKKLHNSFITILKYSDNDTLGIVMSCVLIFINPLILIAAMINCPTWLAIIGVPFGLFSIYTILINCYNKKDLSYTLIIGQIVGILFVLGGKLLFIFPFACQLIVFAYLKWRSMNDLYRKTRRGKKNG